YSELTGTQTNWQNMHSVYTHGYGFVAAPANKVVCTGAPYFVSGGFLGQGATSGATPLGTGCDSGSELIKADRAQVYYGELATEYAVVGKRDGAADPEFDRPAGAGQQDNSYQGAGGV